MQPVKKKRGRPPQHDALASAAAPGTAVGALRNSNNNHEVVLMACGCEVAGHKRLLQYTSAHRDMRRWKKKYGGSVPYPGLHCKRCWGDGEGEKKAASVLEQEGYATLSAVCPGEIWAECSLLGKSVDVYVPRLRLAVEVDGEQHFRNAGAAGRDDAFDLAVVQNRGQGRVKGLVRLHYSDALCYGGGDAWKAAVAQAMHACRSRQVQCFVFYSRAYGRAPLWL